MKKKVLFVILILFVGLFMVKPVFAESITACKGALLVDDGVLDIDPKLPKIVSTIVNIIKIVVPIILVIFGMLDLMKGLTSQKEDEIKKGQSIFVKRLIAGVLVFFVFTVVQLVMSLVTTGTKEENIMTCVNCFINYSDENCNKQ